MNPELRQWLYLPDYKDPPVAQKLVGMSMYFYFGPW